MAKKKKVDNEETLLDNVLNEEVVEEVVFSYDQTAYLPVFNHNRNAYDMFLIRVNTESKECFIEVEEMKYDSVMRASMDLKNRYAQDFVNETMKLKKETKK